MWLPIVTVFFLPVLSHLINGDFCHVRPTSVTCPSLSSAAKVPYVCQNVYVVCFFHPDLFPCLLSNEPHSPRGSEPKPHAIYIDRTAGSLPAKAVRDGADRGKGRGNYHGNFRLNQAKLSLCSLLFSLLSWSTSFVFDPWEWRVARSGQMKRQTKHNCVAFNFCFQIFFKVWQLFRSTPLEHTSSPQLQLNSWHFYNSTRMHDYPSKSSSTDFSLLWCWTKPTCYCKTNFFVFLPPSFCSLAPVATVLL